MKCIAKKLLNEAFAAVEAAAASEQRCPQDAPIGPLRNGILVRLARDGRIKVAIYGRNWRVVTILFGPHTGKSTKLPPGGGKPWKVVEKDDDPLQTLRAKPWPPAVAPKPNPPRPRRQKPWSPALIKDQ